MSEQSRSGGRKKNRRKKTRLGMNLQTIRLDHIYKLTTKKEHTPNHNQTKKKRIEKESFVCGY